MTLLPCPHCGGTKAVRIASTMETVEDEDQGHPEAWAGVCDASTDNKLGGCGASGGYRFSPAEAANAWNERTAVAEEKTPTWAMCDSPYQYRGAGFRVCADGHVEDDFNHYKRRTSDGSWFRLAKKPLPPLPERTDGPHG